MALRELRLAAGKKGWCRGRGPFSVGQRGGSGRYGDSFGQHKPSTESLLKLPRCSLGFVPNPNSIAVSVSRSCKRRCISEKASLRGSQRHTGCTQLRRLSLYPHGHRGTELVHGNDATIFANDQLVAQSVRRRGLDNTDDINLIDPSRLADLIVGMAV